MDRNYWADHIAGLDPETEYEQIYRIMVTHEFPWDMNQSLSFALYRTYAVPSIGRLLKRTGEFTERTQKRYDDTALVLDTVLEYGMDSQEGRTAIRRMNQMHGAYPISNDDKRYVLCTFVTSPIRWIDSYGWRRLTEPEKTGSANYYRELGKLMGIKDIPATHQEFAAVLDQYEADHFGFDDGTWPPAPCACVAASSAASHPAASPSTPASSPTSAPTRTAIRSPSWAPSRRRRFPRPPRLRPPPRPRPAER
jgi:hypothetical protein